MRPRVKTSNFTQLFPHKTWIWHENNLPCTSSVINYELISYCNDKVIRGAKMNNFKGGSKQSISGREMHLNRGVFLAGPVETEIDSRTNHNCYELHWDVALRHVCCKRHKKLRRYSPTSVVIVVLDKPNIFWGGTRCKKGLGHPRVSRKMMHHCDDKTKPKKKLQQDLHTQAHKRSCQSHGKNVICNKVRQTTCCS